MKNSKTPKNEKAEAIAKALRENLRKRKKQKINRKEELEISNGSITKQNNN